MENEGKGAELIAFEKEEDDRQRQIQRSIKNKLSSIESKKKKRRCLRQIQRRRAALELALLQLTAAPPAEAPAAPPAEAPAAPPAEAPAEPQA